MAYKVKYGDTIFDVLLNVCGDYSQINEILSLNGLLSYTPQLTVGQELEVEGLQTSNNATLIRASEFPYNSNLLSDEEFERQLEQILFGSATVIYYGYSKWGQAICKYIY